jgi:RNA polymerase sigma-70 factor (ECF subfamily)
MTDLPASPQSPPVQVDPRADDALFRAIFAREGTYVWHTLRRLGVRQSDLEDVTHDVFVQVYRRIADYDSNRPLRPWLFGFAYRVASDYRRLARHRYEVADDDPRAEVAADAEDAAMRSEDRALVMRALDTLDLDKRAVFVLHDIDERPVPEIAETLAIPLNTAYSRLRAARAQFELAVRSIAARKGAALESA